MGNPKCYCIPHLPVPNVVTVSPKIDATAGNGIGVAGVLLKVGDLLGGSTLAPWAWTEAESFGLGFPWLLGLSCLLGFPCLFGVFLSLGAFPASWAFLPLGLLIQS